MLIDAHSHLPLRFGVLTLQMDLDGVGIHPWKIKSDRSLSDYVKEFDSLKNLHPNPLLVGECGLDRRAKGILGIDLQMELFKAHLTWAQMIQRPLVLHCVHAESDVLHALKANNYKGIILWHDFRGNAQLLHALEDYQIYFSIGPRLITHERDASETLKLIPENKLLLETDDQVQFSIESIYQKASQLLGMNQESLEKKLEENLFAMLSNFNDISAADLINNLRNRALG